jgi:hypothetical protein
MLLAAAGPVNLLGAAVALCFISNVVLIVRGSRQAIDFSSLVLTVFLGVVLLSRTAIAAALASVVLLLLSRASKARFVRLGFFRLATFASLAVALLPLLVDFIDLNQVLRGRSFLWSVGKDLVLSHSTFGVGYLSIEELKEPLIAQATHASAGGGFHSLVIDSWLGAGVIGPVAIVALVLISMIRSRPGGPGWDDLALKAVWVLPFVYGLLRGSSESSGWLIDKNVNVLSAVLWVCVGAATLGSAVQTSADSSSLANSSPQVRTRPPRIST